MIYFAFIPVFAAVFSVAFVVRLTDHDGLLGWWPQVANNLVEKYPDFFGDRFLAIAYRCEACIAGQFALWTSLSVIVLHGARYPVALVLWSITASILIAVKLIKLYE